jgi:hypothetical protein
MITELVIKALILKLIFSVNNYEHVDFGVEQQARQENNNSFRHIATVQSSAIKVLCANGDDDKCGEE